MAAKDMHSMGTDSKRTIKSAEVTFDIFEVIRAHDGATLSEISEALDKAPSTIHQYLTTLELREFLVREDGTYNLSYRFLDFGIYVRQQHELSDIAKTKVMDLVKEIGERAQFVIPEYGCVIPIYADTGDQAVRAGVRVGQRLPMHATAAGKAILAHYSAEAVTSIIDQHGLPQVTEHTITDLDKLQNELATIRETGIAYNKQEDTDGLCAIGTPVLGPDDQPLGALSVSGPEHRIRQEERDREIRNLLRGAGNELELRIEYDH